MARVPLRLIKQLNAFLTLAPDGGEWSASRPSHFTPGAHWIGGSWWVGLRVGLDTVVKRKKSHQCPCQELVPSQPAFSLITTLNELLWLPFLFAL